ncbi:hypothetical protein [uncultured Flavobacterium sp.]|uniref:hypothetical protein n=1 Tax=uncultured Flavobacterium sp. TaxID=165435 RepID=UPI0025E1F14F|nr:hypothetical protein [uncultured Flavobacterium sp.]
MSDKVVLEDNFMTDNFLTVIFMISLLIAVLVFLFKGKDELKTFLSFVVVVIITLFIISVVLIGVKTLF